MNLYLISQTINSGYDTYDSAVVIAENEEAARRVCPSESYKWSDQEESFMVEYCDGTIKREYPNFWVKYINDVDVEYIGKAKEGAKPGVILASFNAG